MRCVIIAVQPSKRVQILLPPETYQILQRLAAKEKQSVSALVRLAVEEQFIKKVRLATKAEALTRLTAMDLPVDNWDVLEAEITDGRYHDHDD